MDEEHEQRMQNATLSVLDTIGKNIAPKESENYIVDGDQLRLQSVNFPHDSKLILSGPREFILYLAVALNGHHKFEKILKRLGEIGEPS